MLEDNPLGFENIADILEERYKAKRNEDNVPPSQMPRLLLVLANLGFPAPAVTVGTAEDGHNSLQLDDYLSRGANPDVPVNVQLSWPTLPGTEVCQAAVLVNRFKVGTWEGFSEAMAMTKPGVYSTQYRELAFLQIPSLEQSFSKVLAEVAGRGLDKLKSNGSKK